MRLPRPAVLLAAVLLAGCPSSDPAAQPSSSAGPLGPERETDWLPFESPHGLVIVTARLNGAAAVRLLVDSGDPAGLTVGEDAARAAGAAVEGAPVQRTLGLFGGDLLALRRVRIDRLDLGGVPLRSLDAFAASDTASFSRAIGAAVDGFIGVGILRRLCLTIDYPARRIRFERRPASSLGAADAVTATVTLRLEAGRMTVPVSLGGQAGHRMILDTASAATFLERSLAGLTTPGDAASMPIIDGGGRRRDLPLRRLPSLSLGEVLFEAVDVALFEADDLRRAGLIEGRTISGIIGADLLARCRVRLDMPRGRLAISPAPAPRTGAGPPGAGESD